MVGEISQLSKVGRLKRATGIWLLADHKENIHLIITGFQIKTNILKITMPATSCKGNS